MQWLKILFGQKKICMRASLDKYNEDLLSQKLIIPSSSPLTSPVFLVEEKKKDPTEGPRFCSDFSVVNKVTNKDSFPLNLIWDIFNSWQVQQPFPFLTWNQDFISCQSILMTKKKLCLSVILGCNTGQQRWWESPTVMYNKRKAKVVN